MMNLREFQTQEAVYDIAKFSESGHAQTQQFGYKFGATIYQFTCPQLGPNPITSQLTQLPSPIHRSLATVITSAQQYLKSRDPPPPPPLPDRANSESFSKRAAKLLPS